MKRGAMWIIMLFFLSCSFISAETAIIFGSQINPVYNLGDTINVPVTIKALNDINGMFKMDLLCNETEINFYKNGVNLVSGEEKVFDSSLVLVNGVIGSTKGTCKIKAILGYEYSLSSEFRISDSLNLEANMGKREFNPGEKISLSGKVTRETGAESNGLIEASLFENNPDNAIEGISQQGTISSGSFSINLSLASGLKAGNYTLRLNAFEKDSNGEQTNNGIADYSIFVKQIPTNLEIIVDNKEIMPGESAKIKAVLHDQTGEPISSAVFITIKNQDKILEEENASTEQVIEYQTGAREPPAQLKVFAVSNELTAEDSFQIKTNEKIDIQIINKTILITNIGNVPYNKTILVQVGETPLNVLVKLGVGESKKYALSAPDGKYDVNVKSDAGDDVSSTMSLTGKAVDITETGGGHYTPLAWVMMIAILGLIAFSIFRKIYKKPFVGKKMDFGFKGFKKREQGEMPVLGASSISMPANRAELSLSIKGEKQEASLICLKIKNLRELKLARGSAAETIQKAVSLTEESKGATYENQDYLFFIFAPSKTRTFKNEKTALEIAKRIQGIFEEHNKMFSQKMEFGISLDYGTIVAKIENGVFRFMAMGTVLTSAKKIASLSSGEVLLGERMNDILRLSIKTDRHIREGTQVYSVREIKRENEEARKFIDRFMSRQQNGK